MAFTKADLKRYVEVETTCQFCGEGDLKAKKVKDIKIIDIPLNDGNGNFQNGPWPAVECPRCERLTPIALPGTR